MAHQLNFEEYESKVRDWAMDRGIMEAASPQAQLLKTLEELGETAGALAKGRHEELLDGVGDVLVTLAIFAAMHNFDLTTALEAAWHEIADRQGRMENGIFIRDPD